MDFQRAGSFTHSAPRLSCPWGRDPWGTRNCFVSCPYSFPQHCMPYRLSVGAGLFTSLFWLVIKTHERCDRKSPKTTRWQKSAVLTKASHHGLEMGGTTGDHERGLLAPFYHCWCPRGGVVFLSSHNKIHDTHIRFSPLTNYFTGLFSWIGVFSHQRQELWLATT